MSDVITYHKFLLKLYPKSLKLNTLGKFWVKNQFFLLESEKSFKKYFIVRVCWLKFLRWNFEWKFWIKLRYYIALSYQINSINIDYDRDNNENYAKINATWYILSLFLRASVVVQFAIIIQIKYTVNDIESTKR